MAVTLRRRAIGQLGGPRPPVVKGPPRPVAPPPQAPPRPRPPLTLPNGQPLYLTGDQVLWPKGIDPSGQHTGIQPGSPYLRGDTPDTASIKAPTPKPPATPPKPANPAQVQPFDAQYEQQVGLNRRTYDQANIDLDEQRSSTIRAYGLDDPTDPFSRAALLREAYHNRQRGAVNSMAARGQLYAGSTQNALNRTSLDFEQDTDVLRKGQNDILSQIARRRAAAKADLEQGNITAAGAALSRALLKPPDPATLTPAAPAKPKPAADPTYGGVLERNPTIDGKPVTQKNWRDFVGKGSKPPPGYTVTVSKGSQGAGQATGRGHGTGKKTSKPRKRRRRRPSGPSGQGSGSVTVG